MAVVGGGLTGLAAAYTLARLSEGLQAGPGPGGWLECHLFEASSRLGGKVQTLALPSAAGTVQVERGPDTLHGGKPRALELVRELGLAGRLVPADGSRRGTCVLRAGRLRRLPEGLEGLVPRRFLALWRSDFLSWPGKLRAALEVLVPPAPDDRPDESVGAFVARRLGREPAEILADALLAGLHAADVWKLSVAAMAPELRQLERCQGGLLRAALAGGLKAGLGRASAAEAARPAAGGTDSPAGGGFWSLRGGLGELVDALERSLAGRVAVHRGCPVEALRPEPSSGGDGPAPGGGPPGAARGLGRWRLALAEAGGARHAAGTGAPPPPGAAAAAARPFDAVILAVPAYGAARLVEPWASSLAALLRSVGYASVAVVALVYRDEEMPQDHPARRSWGALVPAAQGRRLGLTLRALSWFSTKWPHTAPDGRWVVRAFVGRDGDEAALGLEDARLVEAVRADLRRLTGLDAVPETALVFRWPQAMPQYTVGHLERVAEMERATAAFPGLFLAGAAFRGIGLSDCVRQGEQAARTCLAYLGGAGPLEPGRPWQQQGEEVAGGAGAGVEGRAG